MISFYPFDKETKLVTLSKAQLIENLNRYIKPVKGGVQEGDSKVFLFNGIWSEGGFSVSLKLKISNNFIPIINGDFLDSEEGTLIRLTYDLFPATKKLLLFWTVITLLITVFFIGLYQAWIYGAISFGFCLVNYILCRENFKIQLRKSKKMLDKMLS
jgi:hypothetical protein